MVYSGAGAGGKLIHEKTTRGRKSRDTVPLNKRLWILQLNTSGLTAKRLQNSLNKRIQVFPQHEIPRVSCRGPNLRANRYIGLLKAVPLISMYGGPLQYSRGGIHSVIGGWWRRLGGVS